VTDVDAAIMASVSSWETAGNGCTDLRLELGGRPSGTGTNLMNIGRDGENRIIWREDEWLGDPDALAITTIVYRTSTGQILDADIDVNGVDFTWTVTSDEVEALNDVQNTLTHELGHLIGFAHSPDPSTTMFGLSGPGELSKRMLSADDIDAVCTVYPFGAPTPRGETFGPGLTNTCSATRAGSPARILGMLPLSVALLFIRRRRKA
jgi:MYXO-CTERM domain-containing protein